MSVEFTYRNGRVARMEKRYADILQKMNRGSYRTTSVPQYSTRDMHADLFRNESSVGAAAITPPKIEPLISDSMRKFADENAIDISMIAGTGKDGRINKSDVEDAIATRNSVKD